MDVVDEKNDCGVNNRVTTNDAGSAHGDGDTSDSAQDSANAHDADDATSDAHNDSHNEDKTQRGLTDDERRMLEFERRVWRRDSAKDELIRRRFNLSPIRYYQRLFRLIQRREALEEFPTTVSRLLRIANSDRPY
ncbi:DUF3263 domain-containing protein [Corynebacterium parakroppenstedtii]|nr:MULTISPECIES: DUF3263 domain-containing protein [Corynebacterium]KXB50821.1 hypothetical protein HMPREF1861_00923 [Corynebacterium kroppenstedtii]MBY0792394.1 DUF3263 domain-containing protein [Corynebacterium parakroppenstedtii]MBY0793875.1 DUF3263 domain-containing protein [Corynebacterium parakroppenstedtii]MBY0795849.1 DUF3263 domain-containing protein [Corynebacterium parakroppenstedtii]PMC67025.1 DUF3263 domain-containing protein [Corynebacterium kroppenstedtii]